MANVAMKALPQDKALNVRLGLALMVVGLLVVFWSFSGDQAYDLSFFYLAIVGTLLALYGVILLANSRVVSERARKAAAAGASGTASPAAPASTGAREWVRMQCPSCTHVFDAEGVRPFHAACPSCGKAGRVA